MFALLNTKKYNILPISDRLYFRHLETAPRRTGDEMNRSGATPE